MFTVHYPNSRANGSLFTPITFTDFSGATEVKLTTPVNFLGILRGKDCEIFVKEARQGGVNFLGTTLIKSPEFIWCN